MRYVYEGPYSLAKQVHEFIKFIKKKGLKLSDKESKKTIMESHRKVRKVETAEQG